MIFAEFLIAAAKGQPPSEVIRVNGEPYLIRWHLLRSRETGNAYLHQILKSDQERDLHCHPWESVSYILSGTMREVLADGERILTPGTVVHRCGSELHRLEIIDGPVWSLFLTGPKYREWGFMTPDGWVHHLQYRASDER